jgi:shikimate dehydrogenase
MKNPNSPSNKKIAAVIGDPISQSLSPYLHNYWLEKYQIDGSYIALKISAKEFPEFIKSAAKQMPESSFVGCNITIPHKESALKICDYLSESAKQIGAVNTLVFEKDGKISGDNSDHFGFIQNIKSQNNNFNFCGKKVLLLGAGGASRAIVYGLLKEGVDEIFIANRDLEKAKKIADDFFKLGNVQVIPWGKRDKDLADFDMLINSTALGMVEKEELEIDLKTLKKSALVCDIVYKPLMTNLLLQAKQNGNPIITGIGMLIYQGLIGFERWFGVMPEVDDDVILQITNLSKEHNK